MDGSEIVPEDVLSEVLFFFFEGSNKDFKWSTSQVSRNIYSPKTLKNIRLAELFYFQCGSQTENLMIPKLISVQRNNCSSISPDMDMMLNIFPDEKLCMQTDQQQHVFCRIKHQEKETITSRPEFVSGEYLSSAAIKESYEKEIIDLYKTLNTNAKTLCEYDPISSALTAYSINEDGTVRHSDDKVLCVKVILEKEVKDSFMERYDRNKWPWNLVENWEELLTENAYAIPKLDPDDSETGHLRWRLSFSVVEVQLALSLNEIQKRCYRVLKALIKLNVNEGLQEDEKFPSYYLKTLMFWLCENTSTDSWTI